MVRLGQRAVSDMLVIAFMFILLAMAAVFVFDLTARQLEAASDRQMELKSQHLYQTLRLSGLDEYPGTTAIDAAAHQIAVDDPSVPDDYLRSWLEETLDYLLPQGYAVTIEVSHENDDWTFTYPDAAEQGELYITTDNISIAENRDTPIVLGVQTRMFEIS